MLLGEPVFLEVDQTAHTPERCAAAENRWGDEDDGWSREIDAAHPMRSGSHEEYGIAMQMVGHRRSKHALVRLVNWLLVRLKRAA